MSLCICGHERRKHRGFDHRGSCDASVPAGTVRREGCKCKQYVEQQEAEEEPRCGTYPDPWRPMRGPRADS